MIVNDPNGTFVGATSRNEMKTSTVIRGEDRNENEIDGSVWSFTFSAVNPAGAGDFFCYITNTDGSDYVITDFRLFATTAVGNVTIHKVDGTPTYVGSTTITGLGRNTRYTQSPDVSFKTDTDITNLTDLGTYFTIPLETVGALRDLKTTSGIILASNGAVGLKWSAATGEISGTISIAKITAK